MARYTIELRHVCDYYTRDTVESWFKDYNIEDYLLPEQIKALQEFKIFSKDKLAKRIVDHYWVREIGLETPALFEHYAKTTMNEIMQEKLPIIYTMCLSYDPLINVDYTETFHRVAEGNGKQENTDSSNSTSNSNDSSLSITSDTPEGQINKQQILDGNYASNASASESEGTINNTTNTTANGISSNSTNEEYTRHFEGNQGISATYQAMIKQFRQNIVAIDKEIIDELNILFMGLY